MANKVKDLGIKEPSTASTVQGQMELREKVAELCGWERWTGDNNPAKGYLFRDDLPDYPRDLNAMHEAEKILNGGQWETYGRWLAEFNNICFPLYGGYVFQVAHSTAEQRCRAFIAVLSPQDAGEGS